jgi:DNA mismatch repair protein MutS
VDGTSQLDLFAPPPCTEPEHEPAAAAAGGNDALRELLGAIDPDALSPREALERLYELKRLAA